MNNILEFIAAQESSTSGRDKRQLGHRSEQLRLAYLRVAVIVVMSYSAFPHLA